MGVPAEKLTAPTTVRFPQELLLWLQDVADARNDRHGVSGVICDAVEAYRAQLKHRGTIR